MLNFALGLVLGGLAGWVVTWFIVNHNDKGGLSMGVTTNSHGDIEINFGKPVVWFSLEPDQAVAFANLILKYADVGIQTGVAGKNN